MLSIITSIFASVLSEWSIQQIGVPRLSMPLNHVICLLAN